MKIKAKDCCFVSISIKRETNIQIGRKYLLIISQTKYFSQEYTKNSQDSTLKNPIRKWAKDIETFIKEIYRWQIII